VVSRLALAVVLALAVPAIGACSSVELAGPVIRARSGPAAERPIRRIVAVPATCGALTELRVGTDAAGQGIWSQRSTCPKPTLLAVDQAIRSTLELGGFSVIDSERVNAVTATRHELQERSLQRAAAAVDGLTVTATHDDSTTTTTETRGARFEDATPREQLEMLTELGAQGLLSTRVTIGAGLGIGQRRLVTVQLQLLEMPERVLVWARRCELEVGGIFTTDERAMERAARCAVEGIRAR
jgi:hypothetical protein